MTRAAKLHWIGPDDPPDAFPPPEQALDSPEGLLAAGGDLSPPRLLAAYAAGVFPWYEGQPILWWSPDPRAILRLDELKISRSLAKRERSEQFHTTFDQAFAEVMKGCAAPRGACADTWITSEMFRAYVRLHSLGHAHSVETWRDGELVGGLYGVALGGVFFGESMFSRASDASKVALVRLVRQLHERGYDFIDCQLPSTHLQSLGSRNIPRTTFLSWLEEARLRPHLRSGSWRSWGPAPR
ncbi:MAG: leucyl/phenylalanyl-tRNA--protein transferase [Pseudomonadota bacterium]